MRFMLKARFDTDKSNAAAKAGRLGPDIAAIVAALEPEAAYFIAENGRRAAIVIFDMDDPSQLPGVAEPWFLAFGADVEVVPAMTADDLGKAAPSIKAAAKAYG